MKKNRKTAVRAAVGACAAAALLAGCLFLGRWVLFTPEEQLVRQLEERLDGEGFRVEWLSRQWVPFLPGLDKIELRCSDGEVTFRTSFFPDGAISSSYGPVRFAGRLEQYIRDQAGTVGPEVREVREVRFLDNYQYADPEMPSDAAYRALTPDSPPSAGEQLIRTVVLGDFSTREEALAGVKALLHHMEERCGLSLREAWFEFRVDGTAYALSMRGHSEIDNMALEDIRRLDSQG